MSRKSERTAGRAARYGGTRAVLFVLLALGLGSATGLSADTIVFRTGERLGGKVLTDQPDKIVFQSDALGRIDIPRERIQRIERSAPPSLPTFVPPAPTLTTPTLESSAGAATNQPAQRRFLGLFPLHPDPKGTDWIQLKSGEWLRGRLHGMQNRKVEFESDELDDLEFDWKDIHQVQLPRAVVSYGERQTASGALRVDRQKVTISGEEPISFAREELIGITPGQLRELDYWSGKLNAGLNLRAGNSEQVDMVTTARIERRTPNTRLKIDYTGNFNQTDGTETVDNQRANGMFNTFLTRRLFLVTPLVEYYRDPFQNIGQQLTFGAGAGYYLIDRPTIEWLVLGGPAYQRTRFDTVETGESPVSSTPAFFLQSNFEMDLTKRLDLELGYQAIVTSEEAGRITHHATITFELDLTRHLDLDVSFIWDRTENPQASDSGIEPKQNDFRLNLSMGVRF